MSTDIEKKKEKIPHMAIITVKGVVNRQIADGTWHPASVFNDGFNIQFEGKTEKEVVDLLRSKLEQMEESCRTMT